MQNSGRILVLAFDGTAGEFNSANSNVAKLCSALQHNDERQLIYYQPGVGTYVDPGIRGKIYQFLAKTADLAIAWYLDAHVMGGYEFLMNNHLPGDKIVMFGWSRGSYTCRALAGWLDFVGLLPKGNHEQITFAYRVYKSQHALAANFKATFCKSVDVQMVGVWDTVSAVGTIITRTLPFTSNNTIKAFRHAISLDEHRTRYNVVLWNPEEEVTSRPNSVKEMWFAGCHRDVGGGAEQDDAPASLANIPFRWMLHEIQEVNCGVIFDDDALDRLKIPTDCVRRVATTQSVGRSTSDATAVRIEESMEPTARLRGSLPSWEEADNKDITAALHDMLKILPLWWLLQIPTWTGKYLDFTGRRIFPADNEQEGRDQIHPSVLKRMEVNGYRPHAKLPQNWKAFVVNEGGI